MRDRIGAAVPTDGPHVASASSHRLDRAAAPDGWLAAGDAALATDPLSGGGILRALLTGEAAGTALAHWLVGRPGPVREYERWLDRRFGEYVTERQTCYALEARWPAEPFWSRRQPRVDTPLNRAT
jgi:flavin-dependent dehydrogenase